MIPVYLDKRQVGNLDCSPGPYDRSVKIATAADIPLAMSRELTQADYGEPVINMIVLDIAKRSVEAQRSEFEDKAFEPIFRSKHRIPHNAASAISSMDDTIQFFWQVIRLNSIEEYEMVFDLDQFEPV